VRNERFKGALLSALMITSIVALAIPLLSPSPVHAALTSHAPISINGNDNFTLANGVTSGSGTENDPYVIENWDISAENANGIWILNTTAYFIIRNCLVENGGDNQNGICLRNAVNGKIENNTCENYRNGIRLEDNSSNDNLTNNTCKNGAITMMPDSHSIEFFDSSNNLVSGNTCENYGVGIQVAGNSDNNRIYHNNIVNNANQAYDNGSNYWDDGYPSGGNYWSDYIGADNYKGENQDILGSDGVGDNSYPIPGGSNLDRYPLMNLWPPIEVSILPDYQSGLPGAVLGYIVDIKNNENTEVDLYSIVTDNFGWKLASGIKQITLYPFSEVWITLKVTISENAIGDTEDTVTITMASIDNTVSYSGSCIAHVTVIRGVEVSIVPNERKGPPGATLEYTITVKNTGNVEDNYDLTANDNAGWGLEIFPPSLTIPPRGFENATLSVTIPENVKPMITDTITVTAKSQANPSISAENTCIAFSLATFKENLVNGWNLVSFPVASENDTAANLFAGQTYYIWKWDAVYKKYVSSSPTAPVELGVGYWIWVDHDQAVTTSGVPVDTYSENLKNGWNLVGFPVTSSNTTPANLFTGQTYYMWRWSAENKKYVSPPADNSVQLGVGYWIWVDHDQTMTVPVV
jgi:uncharacterized repeat protein (TIGR01451 family)